MTAAGAGEALHGTLRVARKARQGHFCAGNTGKFGGAVYIDYLCETNL